MPETLARIIAALLLVVHAGLGLWALVGFAELLFDVPWSPVSNPLFSPPMLLLQWTLIATASLTFIVGYARRWPPLPKAMLAIYGAMALVCAYQTFLVLTSPTRFRAMAIEYAEYTLILLFLFFAQPMRTRFRSNRAPLDGS
jgi:hypothetical protein